jgi:hypothetical protein
MPDTVLTYTDDVGTKHARMIEGPVVDGHTTEMPCQNISGLEVVLSHLPDSIDVAKMSKGAITTVHNAITATATSTEVDCRGFNSLLVHWVSSRTDKTWVLSILGATGSDLTFVPQIDKTTGLAVSAITTDISGFFVINNIPDFIKVVATETDDGATAHLIELLDYIYYKGIRVLTIDEWYNGLTNPRYRSLPVTRATA